MTKLTSKMVGASALLFLCTAAIFYTGWSSLRHQVDRIQHIYSDHVVPLRDLKIISDRFAVDIVDAAHKARNGNMTSDEALKAMKNALNDIERLWPAYFAQITEPEERKLADETMPLLAMAREAAITLIGLVEKGDERGLGTYVINKMYAAIDPGTEKIGLLIDYSLDASKRHYESAQAEGSNANLLLAGVGVFSLIITMFCGFYAYSGIAKPLAQAVHSLNVLAGGSLDVAAGNLKRKDEIGDISRSLTAFLAAATERRRLVKENGEKAAEEISRAKRVDDVIREFEKVTSEIVTSVAETAEDLQESARQMHEIAASATEQSGVVAASAQETATTVQALAGNTSELAASINEIGQQAEQSSNFAHGAAQRASQADITVRKLSDAGNAIVEVVDLIKSIAAQTNLLALNATIEAARAGDAGRGFAVVASEVKELASQTTRATDVITEHVSGIRNASLEATEAMREVSRIVQEINQVASSIAVAVTEQSAATQGISDNVQQAAGGTEHTNQSITMVAAAAAQTGASASNLMRSSEALSAESQKMRNSVDWFLKAVRVA